MSDFQKLRVLSDSCSVCRECPHGATATQSVFDKGDPASPLVFVGEAPGRTEDLQGTPFVGDAGKLLDKMIAKMREELPSFPMDPYVCNVLKHNPPGNKLLKGGEDIKACAPKLFEQLNLLPNVRVIVALGRVAAQTLLGTKTPIGKLRGHAYHNTVRGFESVWTDEKEDLEDSSSEWRSPYLRVFVVPTWHPSYLLHQPNLVLPRQQCWEDLQLALRCLTGPFWPR